MGEIPVKERLSSIDENFADLTVARQCALLEVPRSTWYYEPVGRDPMDEWLSKRLDRLYTELPFYGVLKMVAVLQAEGLQVGPKRVRRLLREMGLMAIYPKPRLSLPGRPEQKYPYLLEGIMIERPDQTPWRRKPAWTRLTRHWRKGAQKYLILTRVLSSRAPPS